MTSVPQPHAARYNEWARIPLPSAGSFTPTLGVTVVLMCGGGLTPVARTLAALERQTYPRDLIEAIVVDAGPIPNRPRATAPFEMKTLRHHGGGAAGARNRAARAAAHDILVFLDADIILDRRALAAHAAWHHQVSDAVTLGALLAWRTLPDAAAIRQCDDASLSGLLGLPPGDATPHADCVESADLKAPRDDLFRALNGANFGIRKAFFLDLGGCSESLDRCGGEDVELAYRAFNAGALLVPVREALGWRHAPVRAYPNQGDAGGPARAAQLAELIPHPDYRPADAPGRYARPRHVIRIRVPGDRPGQAARTVESLLSGPVRDLVVRIETAVRSGEAGLNARFAAEDRVFVNPERSALEQFPASPLHVQLTAGLDQPSELLVRLEDALGTSVMARLRLEDGTEATIARAWALHRARRSGGSPADFGDVAVAGVRPPPTPRPSTSRPRLAPLFSWRRRGASWLRRVLSEARHVRGLSTARQFARWLIASIPMRIRHRTLARDRDDSAGAAVAICAPCHALCRSTDAAGQPNGSESQRGNSRPAGLRRHGPGVPPVPAFDAWHCNPAGWVRNVEPWAASLGPRRLLPPGATVRREIRPDDRTALRHCHHIEDVQAYHPDAVGRAAALVRLAAMGVPVHLADGGPSLTALIGSELHTLMTSNVRDADIAERERLSIRMRRIALRDHASLGHTRRLSEADRHPNPHDPLPVTILLPTRRPEFLSWALANVARQNYPRLELVIALYGSGFGDAAWAGRLGCPVKVLRVDGTMVLGDVLNAAAAAASGVLQTKVDDDDLYGPHHLWDLVLAYDYSGAQIVSKGQRTTWLAGRNQTVQYALDGTETYRSSHLGGGAMLVSRRDLDGVGGWRRIARDEDRALIRDVQRAGGSVYRTHSAEYLVLRHGGRHAWGLSEERFLARAEIVHPGFCPWLADIDAAETPAGLPTLPSTGAPPPLAARPDQRT